MPDVEIELIHSWLTAAADSTPPRLEAVGTGIWLEDNTPELISDALMDLFVNVHESEIPQRFEPTVLKSPSCVGVIALEVKTLLEFTYGTVVAVSPSICKLPVASVSAGKCNC